MAMYPIATHGYMPFVHGKTNNQTKNKRSKPHVNGGKLHRTENRKQVANQGLQKMYQITLKDKKGQTYKCIVKTDGSTSLPDLCQAQMGIATNTHRSMPNISNTSPSKQRKVLAEKVDAINSFDESGENFSTSLDLRNCGKKEGLFSAFIRFIKEKTGKSEKDTTKATKAPKHKGGKSKRKPRDLTQRKRQRTVSAMSNLDPIAESPNEHEFETEEEDDTGSYNHYSSSCSSDSESLSSSVSSSCNIEPVEQPTS